MYEIVEITQDVWMIPKFKNRQELSDWERLWLNSQTDVLIKGSKIRVDPGDVYAIEDKIGEEMSIEEIFERWQDKFGIYTSPSKEHLECQECDIDISGNNGPENLCDDHITDL